MHAKSKEFSWIWIASLAVLGFLLGPVAMQASAATVATQYPDYAPGQTVVITGSGWEPGEAVVIELHEDPMLDPDRLLTAVRSEEHTSELQSPCNLVCRPLP